MDRGVREDRAAREEAVGRPVDRQLLGDVPQDPALGGLQPGHRGPDGALGAVSLGDGEPPVVDRPGGVAVEGQPAELRDGQPERLGELAGGVERRQLVLGGPLLGLRVVPLVGPGVVLPVDAVAEVDDVLGPIRGPGLAPEADLLGGLRLQRLLVLGQLALGHPVGLSPGDEEAALGELRIDIRRDAAGLDDRSPEGQRVGGALSGHEGLIRPRRRGIRGRRGRRSGRGTPRARPRSSRT